MKPRDAKPLVVDAVNLLVHASADRDIGVLEYELNLQGFTLGYLPADSKVKTLGQALALRAANHYAPRYGEIDDICLSLTAVWKKKNIRTKKVPRAATGPDLKQIFIGSGNAYGRIVEGIFRICPFPPARRDVSITFKTETQKRNFLKDLSNSGLRPLFMMEAETRDSQLKLALVGPGARLEAEIAALKRLVQKSRGTVHVL